MSRDSSSFLVQNRSKILIDWVRFYESEDAIPTESLKDIVDGITEMPAAQPQSDTRIYDIAGRQLKNIRKSGLYIVNSKKVIVK